jgi:hypothetical protein
MTRSAKRAVLKVVAVVLTVLGVLAAALRADVVFSTQYDPAHPTALAPTDRMAIDLAADMRGAAPVSAERAKLMRFYSAAFARFSEHAGYSLLHVIPGVLIFLLVPVQLASRVRARYPVAHRWTGRLILGLSGGTIVSAVFFGVVHPSTPAGEAPTIVAFVLFFAFTAVRGFLSIRQRDIARHREWMLRFYAAALAISTVRIVGTLWSFVTPPVIDEGALFVLTTWMGWLLTIAVAEWWIRTTRPSSALSDPPASSALRYTAAPPPVPVQALHRAAPSPRS